MMIIINYRNILSKLENHIVDKLEIDKNNNLNIKY